MSIVTANTNKVSISRMMAREILDSRGKPTVECSIYLSNGGAVVSSISTSNNSKNTDFFELRDDDPDRMLGMGTKKVVEVLTTKIGPALIGQSPIDQEQIDQILLTLDSTRNAATLGANSLMVASQTVLKAGALTYGWPPYYYLYKKYGLAPLLAVPTCIYGMVDGGRHGNDNLDFQEFQIIPANNFSFERSLEIAVSMFNRLGSLLKSKGAIRAVGPSGGFTPSLYKNTDAFDLLVETAKDINLNIGRDIFFGLDMDANSLHNMGKYKIKDQADSYSEKTWLEYVHNLNKIYGVYSFEDPFDENNTSAWQSFTMSLGDKIRVIGDSLTRTNSELTSKAIKNKYCNTILLKTGQVKTISDMVAVVKLAREANWQVVMSCREGETNDDLIADLAVGLGAEFTKFGPPNRGERIAKYNRLLQISDELRRLQLAQNNGSSK